MNWKIFVIGLAWLFFSIFWIVIFSTQDKEWWIGEGEIKNICDLMKWIENDDTRDAGIIFTLPLFFPAVYVLLHKKKRYWFIYLITVLIAGFWLWQFFIRYQLCLW